MAKAKEDKFVLRQFKDKSSFWWLNNKVYHLNKENSIVFICGGKEDEEEIKYLEEFCKRNKKQFNSREPSIFEQEQKEYKEVLDFGKYSGKKVDEVNDTKYLKWMILNYNFAGKEKIKEEIIEFLK